MIEAADKQMYIAKENNRKRIRDSEGLGPTIVDIGQDGNGYIPTPTSTEEPKVLTRAVS